MSNVVPKNAYILISRDHMGREKIIYPTRKKEEKYGELSNGEKEFIFDYRDLVNYIRENFGTNFPDFMYACKVCEALTVEVKCAFDKKE